MLVGAGVVDLETTRKPEKKFMPKGVDWIQERVAELQPDQHQVVYDAAPLCYQVDELRANLKALPEVFPGLSLPIDPSLLPRSGYWCDSPVLETPQACQGDADCPDGVPCRIREALRVGLADKNCLSFKVKNVTLVETLPTGPLGPGQNELFVFFAQTPMDNPYAFSIFRASFYRIAFFEGKKDPDVAEIPLDDGDFFPIEEK